MPTQNGASRPHNYMALRQAMVRDQLQARGITDQRILQAMREVPRHLFVAAAWQSEAYSDRPLPIAEGQSISQPYIVAMMLERLQLGEAACVLEVGTGSGYQAAILSRMAAQVYTMEYFPTLAAQARTLLTRLGYTNIEVVLGDGSLGLPRHAPYDGHYCAGGGSTCAVAAARSAQRRVSPGHPGRAGKRAGLTHYHQTRRLAHH